jgi:hypothetical protein
MGNPIQALHPIMRQVFQSVGNSRSQVSAAVAAIEVNFGYAPQGLAPAFVQNAGRNLAVTGVHLESMHLANEAMQQHASAEMIFAELNANLAGQTIFAGIPPQQAPIQLARLEPERNDTFSVHQHIEQPGNNPIDP